MRRPRGLLFDKSAAKTRSLLELVRAVCTVSHRCRGEVSDIDPLTCAQSHPGAWIHISSYHGTHIKLDRLCNCF